ncbi:hypothetical protein KC19_8G062500 [Ceratodon purpureus]|uniref:Uncharacterized protein n=1 Tax=Ceratodon purpureus TaxID=3225 RepID=A0A8T0GXT1_CERPU|nr:hypothetical protein KC19_8G062500 [Ceratodon purpureus]
MLSRHVKLLVKFGNNGVVNLSEDHLLVIRHERDPPDGRCNRVAAPATAVSAGARASGEDVRAEPERAAAAASDHLLAIPDRAAAGPGRGARPGGADAVRHRARRGRKLRGVPCRDDRVVRGRGLFASHRDDQDTSHLLFPWLLRRRRCLRSSSLRTRAQAHLSAEN